jgi:predicted nucleotidyltransferase
MAMKAVGMISEFNPLHNGHIYALRQARERSGADVLVVVMAGNYVQRGEPALLDKWARTELALAAGADLVVELPISAAVQSAREFAQGGVQQLASLGVQTLAFGTELPELDYAGIAREQLDEERYGRGNFTDYTQTYASQLAGFYARLGYGKITAPNAMLGLAYAQAAASLAPDMHLLPLLRRGARHDGEGGDGEFRSGSAIRERVARGLEPIAVPKRTAELLASRPHYTWNQLWPFLQYRLQTAELAELRQIDQMSEGLEYRLRGAAAATDFADFLAQVKSKRYTYARLRRLSLNLVLNLQAVQVQDARWRPVTHVLGFNARGRELLHAVKKDARLPIVTRVSQDMIKEGGALALTQRADSLIEMLGGGRQNYGRQPLMEDNEC